MVHYSNKLFKIELDQGQLGFLAVFCLELLHANLFQYGPGVRKASIYGSYFQCFSLRFQIFDLKIPSLRFKIKRFVIELSLNFVI
jgi:hypothetical protein